MKDEDLYRDERDWESEPRDRIRILEDQVAFWKRSSTFWKHRANLWRNIANIGADSPTMLIHKAASEKWKALAKQYRSKYRVASQMLGMIVGGDNELRR